MGMVCTICSHPDRLEIDRQIVANCPHLKIAKRYGLTNTAVRNHAHFHLSRQLLKSTEIAERLETGKLLDLIEGCLTKAKNILEQAEVDKKPGLQLQALREIRGIITMMGNWRIEHQKMELAIQKDQAEQLNGRVIDIPVITDTMTAREAEALYREFIQSTKISCAGTVVLLPQKHDVDSVPPSISHSVEVEEEVQEERREEEPEIEPEEETPQPRRKRTRLPGKEEEAEIEAILEYEPPAEYLLRKSTRIVPTRRP